MKTITIRLPDVEAAMLAKLQKNTTAYKRVLDSIAQVVRQDYNGKGSMQGPR
jgi:hypothetical protein